VDIDPHIEAPRQEFPKKGNGALISIKQFTIRTQTRPFRRIKEAELEDEFYTKLSPENITTFLKSSLVELTPEEKEEFYRRIGTS
jgi:hypothetical protein